jgi:hypothetical protein
MAENGVIFSDGIEADDLDFNSGTEAAIGVAERQGRLVADPRGHSSHDAPASTISGWLTIAPVILLLLFHPAVTLRATLSSGRLFRVWKTTQ